MSNPFKIIESNDDLMEQVLRRSGVDVRAVSKNFRQKHAAMRPRLPVEISTDAFLAVRERDREGDIDRISRIHETMDVRSVRMEHYPMTPNDMESLAAWLPRCPLLRKLELWDTAIGPEGMTRLAEALPECPNLTHLVLRYNSFGTPGARALAEVLPRCPKITLLDLMCNYIDMDGLEALFSALALCPQLENLSLGLGFMNFSNSALALFPHLENLGQDRTNLSNYLTPAPMAKLETMLLHCRSLTHLELRYTLIDHAVAERLAAMLAAVLPQCRSLTHLVLSGTHLQDDDDDAVMLRGVVSQCPWFQSLKIEL